MRLGDDVTRREDPLVQRLEADLDGEVLALAHGDHPLAQVLGRLHVEVPVPQLARAVHQVTDVHDVRASGHGESWY